MICFNTKTISMGSLFAVCHQTNSNLHTSAYHYPNLCIFCVSLPCLAYLNCYPIYSNELNFNDNNRIVTGFLGAYFNIEA